MTKLLIQRSSDFFLAAVFDDGRTKDPKTPCQEQKA
jgi:hypothetical protein